MKGTKTIPYASMSAIQYREPGTFVNGYIQFTIPGGNESKGGVFSATNDENTVLLSKNKNPDAAKVKTYIESRLHALRSNSSPQESASLSAQISQLALLRDQGSLTDAEFQSAKAKLLG